MASILIVEDERVLAKNLRDKLRAHDHEVHVAHTCEDALTLGGRILPAVAILDVRLPDGDGIELLKRLKRESSPTDMIVVTAHGNERIAVDAMKAGAFEYLTKPVDLEELQMVVARAVEQQQARDNLRYLRSQEKDSSGLDRIIGESAAIRDVKKRIERLVQTEAIALPDPPTILITGETGTGKDLAARAIHYQGPRRGRPFIHVNCTALPSTLFESELFGHLRGAFTSATQAKRGLFEIANGGTLFLDEIGHLEPEVQGKLLHAIEHRQIRPVGGTETRVIDAHIIAATNRDLQAAVEAGEFRRDLYHRLRVIELRIPPLRERRDDIPVLASHFLAMHAQRFRMGNRRFSEAAVRELCRRDWRGNVRELTHLIESCILQVEREEVDVGDLPVSIETHGTRYGVKLPGGHGIVMDFESGSPTLEEVEQSILQAAYDYANQNLSRAARMLGITREALRYRLNKNGATKGNEAVKH